MKKVFLSLFFFSFSILSVHAQITVTLNDYIANGQLGDTIAYSWVTNQDLDIGQLGSNTWDFSSLTSEFEDKAEFILAAGTPYQAVFPDAFHCIHEISSTGGQDIWSYVTQTDNIISNYGETIPSDDGTFSIKYSQSRDIIFPLVYESTSHYNGFEFNMYNDTQDTNSLVVDTKIDAYGSVVFPNGKTHDALRMLITEIRDFSGFIDTSRSLVFYTKTGSSMIFFLGPGSPTVGTSHVGSVTWLDRTATGVDDIASIPDVFSLKQNYPNPFNPTTVLEFSISDAQKVKIKIFNSLGEEVLTLLNEYREAGVYSEVFNAENLPSGIYYAELSSKILSKTIKMTLLK